ncbi:MAG TPA: hypothetical protein VM122_10140 [Usitatibacter sp.]|nr:hypothetical protein [Usitatibacter sp.]
MKRLFSLAAIAALGGCATTPDNMQLADASCKVAPLQVGRLSGTNRPQRVDPLDQRWAEMQLASSDYRFRALARNGAYGSNVEEALRDCAAVATR